MTKKEAISKINNTFPDMEIRKYKEYKNQYMFEVVPKGQVLTDTVFFDSTYSVDKDTGLVRPFNPGMLSEDERPKTGRLIDRLRELA